MTVSPPGDPDTGEQDARAIHVDHAQGTQVGDHGTQDNRFRKIAAGRDALVAGRDFHVQDLHLHLEGARERITAEQRLVGATAPVLPSVSRSSYLRQVGRIAPPYPPGLRDREAELAELARFCLGSEGLPYAWWRAEAWAGKSALLSTFVLRPPSDLDGRVQIASFFITARLAAQDNREAFTQVLLEQLAELTGQVLPAALPEVTREGYLLDLLAQAAVMCQRAGGRLVLLVDGLDEDRGVTVGPHAHSIAGLLPADPPAGMRVIVAGRPNPPIPDDVPDWHPLRDPAIVRSLSSSPHARDMQRLGRQELHRLLMGSAAERDLLGLLTAARGGLSGPDLAELMGISLWEVEEILHTVAGRTFIRRASRWAPNTGPEVYLLGHEELQAAAERYLADRIPVYRDQLQDWFGAYRDREWPPETPEYLLSGYYGLLTALGDLPRMITCATDAARHDRMLRVTGGDGAALAEARTALDYIAAQQAPDVTHALAVARHRDKLADRNSSIPLGLPAVWAAVGQVARAEALATSFADPYWKARALVKVAGVMAKAGQYQQATAIVAEAETVARTITDLRSRAEALARVAGVMAKARRYQEATTIVAEAEMVARTYTDPHLQAMTLGRIAEILIEAGQYQWAASIVAQAGTAAHAVTNLRDQVWALASVAAALAKGGQQQAAAIAVQAETAARALTDPQQQAMALASVAAALGKAGRHHEAEIIALAISDQGQASRALTELAETLNKAGDRERAAAIAVQAEAAARAVTDPQTQAFRLAQLAAVLSEAGQYQHAENIAHAITNRRHQAEAFESVAEALAKAGRHHDAETIALVIGEPGPQAEALTKIAEALSDAGEDQEAVRTAIQAETAARSIIDPRREANAFAVMAEALARTGHHDEAATIALQAETAARSIADPEKRLQTLSSVAEALTVSGRLDEAVTIAVQAEMAAQSITDPQGRARALESVAGALAGARQYQRAQTVACSITDTEIQLEALAHVAGELSRAGEYDEAVRVAVHAETLAHSGTSPRAQAVALAEAAWNLAQAGQREQAAMRVVQAASIIRSIVDKPFEQARALPYLAGALAESGQYQEAEAIALSITDYPNLRDEALAIVADSLLRAGERQHAEGAAGAITDPDVQAIVLSQVAEALAEAGEVQSASRLVARACAIGSWLTAAGPVLKLNPTASGEVVCMLKD